MQIKWRALNGSMILTTIESYARVGTGTKIGEMSAYLQSLLDVPVRESVACHSGNDIIDAIIN